MPVNVAEQTVKERQGDAWRSFSCHHGDMAPQVTPYVVTCHSATGYFDIVVEATSRARALKHARMIIEQFGWVGTPYRVRRVK